jgi:hypothetical protein
MNPLPGPVPIIVGVTGHRAICLKHEEKLREAIAKELAKAGGDGVPLVILCGLASGADRLVAEEALKAGHRLVVALPMPKDDYENEFRKLGENEESIRRFKTLFAQAENTYVVCRSAKSSEEAYMELGREIARCSHLVLALWDGGNEDAPGGTRWVVEERLGYHHAGCEVAVPKGPVDQIVAHRSTCPASLDAYETRWLSPKRGAAGDGSMEDFRQHIASYVRTFNRDAQAVSETPPADLEAAFKAADALAVKFRHWTTTTWFLIFAFVLGAATSLAVFAHRESHRLSYLVAYGLFLGAALVAYVCARIFDVQNKGQDYRALAEGLRVARGWRELGITDFVSDVYLTQQADETRWIRQALGALERLYKPQPRVPVKEVIDRWIRPQWSYYANAIHRDSGAIESFEKISQLATVLSVALAAILFFGKLMPATWVGYLAKGRFDLIVILAAVTAVIAGLAHNVIEKLAWKEHVRRYTRMSRILEDSMERLEPSHDSLKPNEDEAICLLKAVALEELDENASWLQTHRARPLEVSIGS